MAASLVESLSGDYDPDEFDDEYRDEMERLVEAKLGHGEAAPVPTPKEDDGGGKVVDLLSALQLSVERARTARGEEPAKPSAKKATAKATTSKKATVKKAPAKKAAAKATSAKKAAGKTAAKTARATTTKKAARKSA